MNILLIFQEKYDIILDITKKGNIKMNIEEKLLQPKGEYEFQKIHNNFKKIMNIEEKLLQAKAEIAFQKIHNDFKKTFSKNSDEIFSIFEDKKFINIFEDKNFTKRIQKNKIYMFKDTGIHIFDPTESDKICYRVFEHSFYRITYQENELVIEYFVLNREIIKDEEFAENIEKWNIKDFNFCDNLENFHIKYEIRLGEKSFFKSIKKQENSNTDIFLEDTFGKSKVVDLNVVLYNCIFLEGTFGKLFVKALEFSDLSSGFAKDIIKLYYENKMFNVDFEFADEIDEKDFKKFKSLPDFLSFKYNVPCTRKLRKLPLSIMEEFFKDEFLRFDENNYISNFISRNKQTFLAERMNVNTFENPKGIIETYFDVAGIYDKFYNSKIREYEILEKKARKLNQFPAYTRGRKGTDKYVKEILRDAFNLGKNLNIRNIVKRIEKCNSFQNLENLHNKLIKKTNEQEIENIPEYKINIPERNMKIGNFIVKKFKEYWNEGKIEFIKEQRRLYLEGLNQSNCVYSYLSIIENGKCIILSYEEKGHIFTIEVIINENKFYVAQCLGRFNKRTEKSEEIENKINSLDSLYSF